MKRAFGRRRVRNDQIMPVLMWTAMMLFGVSAFASEPQPAVGPRVRVSPPAIGRHGLIDLSIDRDKPNSIVVCGYRHSAAQSASVGFVYRSDDDGHTWREVLRDDSSYWVTEESCASGAGGKAYFMDFSQTMTPQKAPKGEQGDIHLFSSSDGGQTWTKFSKAGWLDHTAMAVDSYHGPMRGRMYVFGAERDQDEFGSSFHRIELITSDDRTTLHGPVA